MDKLDQGQGEGNFAVFEIEGEVFTFEDVVRTANYFGTLRQCREEVRTGVAADQRARRLGLEPSVTRLQSMSDAFRYEHDLITAEEAERWLERRGLTVEDFHEYILRQYWKAHGPENPPGGDGDDLPGAAEVDRLVLPELVMSGEFDGTAVRLSRRLAVARAQEPGNAPPAEAVECARARFLDRAMLTEEELPNWLERIGADRDWLDTMLRIDTAYRRQCAELLNDHARERMLHAQRLPLTRIDVEVLALKSEDAAREALLCVAQDGVAMADLARECGYPYRRVDLRLGDLDEELRRVFVSAAPGEVLEPMEDGGAHQLCRLIGKIEPDLSDEETRQRVDERILDSFFGDLTARHVRWLLTGEGAE